MSARAFTACAAAALLSAAAAAHGHGCEPLDRYLVGHYHGECDEQTELAQGRGEARGADRYVGEFSKGRPAGTGVYTWESGARLEGNFLDGLAHGRGVYVSAAGKRYEGDFTAGRLEGLRKPDCPATPGPLNC